MRTERVVASRFSRLAVAEQVRRNDSMGLSQQLNDLVPLRGAASDAVDQHHGRSLARDIEVHALAVQRNLDALDHRRRPHLPVTPFGNRLSRRAFRSWNRGHVPPRYRFAAAAPPDRS